MRKDVMRPPSEEEHVECGLVCYRYGCSGHPGGAGVVAVAVGLVDDVEGVRNRTGAAHG